MNKLLALLTSIVVLTVTAQAQLFDKMGIRPVGWQEPGVHTQSTNFGVGANNLSLLWFRDGLNSDYKAVAMPIFQVIGLDNRVQVVAMGAVDNTVSQNNVYLGTGLSVDLYHDNNFNIKAYGGWKGLNLGSNFSAAQGKEAFVWGFGVSIPVRVN